MKAIDIFGNQIQVPDDVVVAVMLSTRRQGTIGENYGVEYHYLKVIFLIDRTTIEEEFLLAKGTDGHGDAKPFNKELFNKIHKKGFPEEIKSELAIFLMSMYNEGQVRKKDMLKKVDELFLTKDNDSIGGQK